MDTKLPLMVVVCIGLAAMMFQLSGFEAAVGADPAENLDSGDELNESAENLGPDQGVEGSAGNADDGEIVGLIISGMQSIAGFVGVVVLLPFELQNMGFPYYFAYPVGVGSQIMIGVGLIQAVTNRYYR